MPIYDFQCSSCGFKDEVMRKISAASTEVCPQCSAETFSKQLSAPSFQLTGSGWYATDFKNGSNKATTTTPVSTKTSEQAKTESNATLNAAASPASTPDSGSEKKSDATPAPNK